MEYQKTINFSDNTPYQPSKFRTKKLVQSNNDSPGTYNTNGQFNLRLLC